MKRIILIFIAFTIISCTRNDKFHENVNKIEEEKIISIVLSDILEQEDLEEIIYNNEDVMPNLGINTKYIERVDHARLNKKYFHLSGEYISIDGNNSLLYLEIFNQERSLMVSTTDSRNDPNYGSWWYGMKIVSILQNSNNYVITVSDEDGYDDYHVFRSNRQFILTQLDDMTYEINLISSNASDFLLFLDKKQFIKNETLIDFSPTHFIARYEYFDGWDERAFVYKDENEDDEYNYYELLVAGNLVQFIENGNKNRVNIKFIGYGGRRLLNGWINADLLEEF